MSGFASASGSSGFGALGGGFSGVGGGFTATGKSGGLTSFASPDAPATFGESKAQTLGAEEPEEDDENDENDEEDTTTFEAEKTDERFYEQISMATPPLSKANLTDWRPVATGEEEERTFFAAKAKLFHFKDGEWKERGLGTFKLNGQASKDHPGKLRARMIMRNDGNMRVMLNSPLFKGMAYGDHKNECPPGKQIHLACLEGNATIPLLLRVSCRLADSSCVSWLC